MRGIFAIIAILLLVGCATLTLHEAAERGKTEQARALIDGGANVNAKDEYGNTPLHWGCRQGANRGSKATAQQEGKRQLRRACRAIATKYSKIKKEA